MVYLLVYKIVEGTKTEFEKQMNEISKENYIVQGSLVVTNIEGTTIYHQLMMKATPNEEETIKK